eukprot:g9555.t1 g9555   contig37:239603-242777(+)
MLDSRGSFVSLHNILLMNRLVLIGGSSGSGKSYLVDIVSGDLLDSGWDYIPCKFHQNLPVMSNIASAIEVFLSSMFEDEYEQEYSNAIASALELNLSSASIVSLCELIPSLRALFPHVLRRVISDADLSVLGRVAMEESSQDNSHDISRDNSQEDGHFLEIEVEHSRNRMNFLLRSLVNAISNSAHRALILFFDDLQWADQSSLDSISSFLMDFDHIQQLGGEGVIVTPNVLFVGAYRKDEVDDSHMLAPYFTKWIHSATVAVTALNLDAMNKADANVMVSEVLRLPERMTRSLTDVVQSKTLGNPYHVKEFLKSIVDESILNYSLVEKRWVWDIEAVKATSIDENVLELLQRKLLRMSGDVQVALNALSCFGSQIDMSIISLLYTEQQRLNFIDNLEKAVQEQILERRGSAYSFVHDLLRQAAYDLMTSEEKGRSHYVLGIGLITNLPEYDEPQYKSIAFIGIDQINKAKALRCVTDDLHSVKFASLNLLAGERTIGQCDYVSALSYFEYGISFLDGNGWQSSYQLCLRLHESACLACFASAQSNKMMSYVDELLNHATCLEDRFCAYQVMVQSLGALGNIEMAIDKAFSVLEELGETLPDATPTAISSELTTTKKLLESYTKEDILALPRTPVMLKCKVMKMINAISSFLFVASPRHLPLLSCRMVKLSLKHGLCPDSAIGFALFAHSLGSVLRDIERGYHWGKVAVAVMESFTSKGLQLQAKVKCIFHSFLSFWVEPVQSTAKSLHVAHQEGLQIGDLEFAMWSACHYCRQSLMCGDNLQIKERECEAVAMQMAQFKQQLVSGSFTSHYQVVVKLSGCTQNPFEVAFGGAIVSEDELIQQVKASGKLGTLQTIHFDRMFVAYWLKEYEKAAELAEKYRGRMVMRFSDVYHVFYEGLLAFRFLRCSSGETRSKWMDLAQESLTAYRTWVKHSAWNFENKLLLLEAEHLFTRGETEAAKELYEESIVSARKHRFVHEEGLAMELFGEFQSATGNAEEAKEQKLLARVCYEKWGAFGLLKQREILPSN